MSINYVQKALMLKALSDPNRLLIIDYLKEGERCACKILEQLKISQPTLSHHMRILCEAELVQSRKDGKWMHYTLSYEKFLDLSEYLAGYSVMIGDGNSGNCC